MAIAVAKESLLKGRLSTVDLLVLSRSEQLLINSIFFRKKVPCSFWELLVALVLARVSLCFTFCLSAPSRNWGNLGIA